MLDSAFSTNLQHHHCPSWKSQKGAKIRVVPSSVSPPHVEFSSSPNIIIVNSQDVIFAIIIVSISNTTLSVWLPCWENVIANRMSGNRWSCRWRRNVEKLWLSAAIQLDPDNNDGGNNDDVVENDCDDDIENDDEADNMMTMTTTKFKKKKCRKALAACFRSPQPWWLHWKWWWWWWWQQWWPIEMMRVTWITQKSHWQRRIEKPQWQVPCF